MDESAYEPRNPAAPRKAARHRKARAGHGDVFPLARPAAVRMWLVSVLVLAVAAVSAWSMRVKSDPTVVRIVLPEANDAGGAAP